MSFLCKVFGHRKKVAHVPGFIGGWECMTCGDFDAGYQLPPPPPFKPIDFGSQKADGALTVRDAYALSMMKVLLEKYDAEPAVELAVEAYEHADALIKARDFSKRIDQLGSEE